MAWDVTKELFDTVTATTTGKDSLYIESGTRPIEMRLDVKGSFVVEGEIDEVTEEATKTFNSLDIKIEGSLDDKEFETIAILPKLEEEAFGELFTFYNKYKYIRLSYVPTGLTPSFEVEARFR